MIRVLKCCMACSIKLDCLFLEKMDRVKVEVDLGEKAWQVNVSARKHEWYIDEPEDMGGSDSGATPSEMVFAGLGACTAITCKMYAQRKNWPLKDVHVVLELLEKEAKSDGQFTRIMRQIVFEGPLDEAQKDRLLQIAGLCPVAKMLKGSIEIESSWINQK